MARLIWPAVTVERESGCEFGLHPLGDGNHPLRRLNELFAAASGQKLRIGTEARQLVCRSFSTCWTVLKTRSTISRKIATRPAKIQPPTMPAKRTKDDFGAVFGDDSSAAWVITLASVIGKDC